MVRLRISKQPQASRRKRFRNWTHEIVFLNTNSIKHAKIRNFQQAEKKKFKGKKGRVIHCTAFVVILRFGLFLLFVIFFNCL